MKKWQTTTLGDICDIINGRNQKEVLDTNGAYPVYGSAGNLMGLANKYICEAGTVIIGRKGNISTPHFITEKFWNVDTAFGIYPKNEVMLPRFNYYQCLNIDFASRNKGTTIPSLVKSDLKTIVVSYPTDLKEQQQIVEKLDTAFDLIDRAKANIEKNIQNAKELYNCRLHQIFVKDDTDMANLGNYVDIKTGKLDANAMKENGKYPFFTCARQIYYINNYAFDCEAVLLAGNNASGDFNVKHFNGKFNAYQRTYVITGNPENINLKYIKYRLENYLTDFKNMSIGANTKFLKIGMIKSVPLFVPKVDEQIRLVKFLDHLSEQTELLQQKYQQKIANLEELKKSILEKAFKGQLN